MNYKGSCHCGAIAFEVEGEGSHEGHPMAAINVRCLEGVDFSGLPVKHFDGKSL